MITALETETMGKTYRGKRKQFGSKKAQEHRSRAKWSSENRTRLRTLSFDIAEFQAHEDYRGENLHTPFDVNSTVLRAMHDLKSVSDRRYINSVNLTELTIEALELRKRYAGRQTSYTHRLLSIARAQSGKVWDAALLRLERQNKKWSTQAGTVGQVWSEKVQETKRKVG